MGVVINRIGLEKPDIVTQKIEKVLGVRVLGVIPEDPNVRRAASSKTPVVIKYPVSGASMAIKKIAAQLAGISYEEARIEMKEGFVDRFAKALFKGKK